jgi:hypothetical protein
VRQPPQPRRLPVPSPPSWPCPTGLARRGRGAPPARPGKACARRAAWGGRADPRRGHQREQGGRGWADAGGWARVKSGFIFPILAMNGDLLEPANWTWGLALIALTIAIHATGVVVLALVSLRIRARIANRRFGLRYVIPIVIGLVAAAGLLLAVLHGIEAAIWAAAYLWLGALDSPLDAILYSVEALVGFRGLTHHEQDVST